MAGYCRHCQGSAWLSGAVTWHCLWALIHVRALSLLRPLECQEFTNHHLPNMDLQQFVVCGTHQRGSSGDSALPTLKHIGSPYMET